MFKKAKYHTDMIVHFRGKTTLKLTHIEKLYEFAKLSGPTADVACDKCPEELDIHHMALNHGWMKKLLKGLTPEELEVKRNEVQKPKDPRNLVKKRRSDVKTKSFK